MDKGAVPVLLQVLTGDIEVPSRAHPGDAGLDLHAATEHVLEPGGRTTVGTGLAMALPAGYAAYVLPRSGLAAQHGVTVLNAPGTVDAGYRGEIKVTLLNTDPDDAFTVRCGDRIAQLVIQPVLGITFTEVQRLPASARGAGGHGSTGGFTRDDHTHSED
ncbi:MAG: dUTP diphosphatase [Ornithinimicrobium sp.]